MEAINEINDGGAPMSATTAKKVINAFQQFKEVIPKHTALSERELEVLQLLSSGLLYKEAANRLGLRLENVRSYCRKIYEKLHVNTKLEAINLVFHRE